MKALVCGRDLLVALDEIVAIRPESEGDGCRIYVKDGRSFPTLTSFKELARVIGEKG